MQNSEQQDLRGLGYAQELLRNMGGFANFAISFSVISVLTGAVLLYGYGLQAGGPYVMTVGWPLATLFTLLVAASLAEIASAIPTAGAAYHWAAFLGNRGWGWLTGWLNLVALISITAGIAYGMAEFMAPLLGYADNHAAILTLFVLILLSHGLLNHFGARWLGLLNSLSAWYHVAAVLFLVGWLAKGATLQPLAFLWRNDFVADSFRVASGVPHASQWWFFCLGLLQAQWTYTGYDASAHVSEETRLPRVNAPWGIYTAVALSGVVGYVLIVMVTLAVHDLQALGQLTSSQVFMAVMANALGVQAAKGIMWLAAVAMWFCGLSSLTASARMVYAFARDGGLPAAHRVAHVSSRWRAPVIAVWLVVVVSVILASCSGAFSSIVSLGTITAYLSYGIPVALRLWRRRRGRWQAQWDGPWHLGRAGGVVNGLALLWIAFITVLFVAPPNQQTGTAVLVLAAALLFGWFGLRERQRFRGPHADDTEAMP